jgi:molecular chaperone GrpE (heat shock protein)
MRKKNEGFSDLLNKTISDRAIGELMLAKTALEEKYEQIDKKEKLIKELQKKNKKLEAELEKLKATLFEIEETQKTDETGGFNKGSETVIKDLLQILSKYDSACCAGDSNGELTMLVDSILDLFIKRYGLDVIDGPVDEVDPVKHQVVEVIKGKEKEAGVVRLARGFRMGEKIITPMKVKVIKTA